MKAIAEKVGVSERTVRRYVRGVEPEVDAWIREQIAASRGNAK